MVRPKISKLTHGLKIKDILPTYGTPTNNNNNRPQSSGSRKGTTKGSMTQPTGTKIPPFKSDFFNAATNRGLGEEMRPRPHSQGGSRDTSKAALGQKREMKARPQSQGGTRDMGKMTGAIGARPRSPYAGNQGDKNNAFLSSMGKKSVEAAQRPHSQGGSRPISRGTDSTRPFTAATTRATGPSTPSTPMQHTMASSSTAHPLPNVAKMIRPMSSPSLSSGKTKIIATDERTILRRYQRGGAERVPKRVWEEDDEFSISKQADNQETARQKQARLKAVLGRRYLSEAIDEPCRFGNPIERCRCRVALCLAQEVLGDDQGFIDQLLQCISDLKPLLDDSEAKDMFLCVTEKLLVKNRNMPEEQKLGLLLEAARLTKGEARGTGVLAYEIERCERSIREAKAIKAQTDRWEFIGPQIAPFLSNKRRMSCVCHGLLRAMNLARVRESRERRSYRLKLAKLEQSYLKPREVRYPQCCCNDTMCPVWNGGTLVFICRKGRDGCRAMMTVKEWNFAEPEPEEPVDTTLGLEKVDGDVETSRDEDLALDNFSDEGDSSKKKSDERRGGYYASNHPTEHRKRFLNEKKSRSPSPARDPHSARARKKNRFQDFLEGEKHSDKITRGMLESDDDLVRRLMKKLGKWSTLTKLEESMVSDEHMYENKLYFSSSTKRPTIGPWSTVELVQSWRKRLEVDEDSKPLEKVDDEQQKMLLREIAKSSKPRKKGKVLGLATKMSSVRNDPRSSNLFHVGLLQRAKEIEDEKHRFIEMGMLPH